MRGHVYLVACAAPPANALGELVELLMGDGWLVHVVATPAAVDWLDLAALETLTGSPVVYRARRPGEEKRLPRPDLVIVAPASFNTINKWVCGVNDNAALGLLNEALGGEVPIVVSPYAKATLAAHPAFTRHLSELASWGVTLTERDALRPAHAGDPYRWHGLLDSLPRRG